MDKKKICLISSSGGHFEQLMMLKTLQNSYDIYIVTEKTRYIDDEGYYVDQINRQEKKFFFSLIKNFFQSLKIFLKEKPDIIISTGALCVVPTFIIGKIFGKKLIFIESFAKVNSPTLTGKFLYNVVDIFIVQWKEMQKVYPKSVYLGSIY